MPGLGGVPDTFVNLISSTASFVAGNAAATYKTQNLNPKHASGTNAPVGNAGVVFVETNLDKWDLLVTTRNGGFLKMNAEGGFVATPDMPADPSLRETWVTEPTGREECLAPGIMFQGACVDNSTGAPVALTPIDTTYSLGDIDPGRYLRTANNEFVPVSFGIGTIGNFENSLPTSTILFGTASAGAPRLVTANVESFAWLDSLNVATTTGGVLSTGIGSGSNYTASVAEVLGNAVMTTAGPPATLQTEGFVYGAGIHGVTATRQFALAGDIHATDGLGNNLTSWPTTWGSGLHWNTGLTQGGAHPLSFFIADNAGTPDASEALPNYFTRILDWQAAQTAASFTGIGGTLGSFRGWTEGRPERYMANPDHTGPTYYNAMAFFVNAVIDFSRVPGGSALTTLENGIGAGGRRGNNPNGTYTEDLIFTFWGEW